MGDGGRSSTIAVQVGVVNHPQLRRSRGVVVSVLEKGRYRNLPGHNLDGFAFLRFEPPVSVVCGHIFLAGLCST